MQDYDYLTTDYCIVGFPKCGTDAIARFMAESPGCHLAKMNGRWESPYFASGIDPASDYVPDKKNGHKFSVYARNSRLLRAIIVSNPNVLLIFSIRDLGEVLLSWHAMHKRIAERGKPENHFAAQAERNEFFKTCDVNAYFEQYAQQNLNHAERLKIFNDHFTEARAVFVSQARLAVDAGDVMRHIHETLGLDAGEQFYADLPKGHVSKFPKDLSPLAPHVQDFVREQNDLIMQQLARLPAERNLTLYTPGGRTF